MGRVQAAHKHAKDLFFHNHGVVTGGHGRQLLHRPAQGRIFKYLSSKVLISCAVSVVAVVEQIVQYSVRTGGLQHLGEFHISGLRVLLRVFEKGFKLLLRHALQIAHLQAGAMTRRDNSRSGAITASRERTASRAIPGAEAISYLAKTRASAKPGAVSSASAVCSGFHMAQDRVKSLGETSVYFSEGFCNQKFFGTHFKNGVPLFIAFFRFGGRENTHKFQVSLLKKRKQATVFFNHFRVGADACDRLTKS